MRKSAEMDKSLRKKHFSDKKRLEAIPKPHLGCKWLFFRVDGVGLHREGNILSGQVKIFLIL